jgi:hypothetical protein
MTKPFEPTFGDLADRAAHDLVLGVSRYPYRPAPDVAWSRRDVELAWGLVGTEVLRELPPDWKPSDVWALNEFGDPEGIEFD